jgi:LPXTG-motif cell wall-anchored protein
MKLGRGSGIALIAAMCAIVLALFLVPIRTFAGEESAAETAASTAATVMPSTADSTETAGSSTDSTSAKTATGTSSESVATDASSSSSSASSDSSSSSGASEDPGSSSSSAGEQSSSDNAATTLAAQILASPLTATGGIEIKYDTATEIHYVVDSESANGRIILYCMNNASHWPHSTPSIPTVPSYIQGYLTPDKFKSPEDYEACMNKLLAILYAGYPYNGLNMYQIVDKATGITEDQFNAMLTVPDVLRTDFPSTIGNEVFSYDDYTNKNTDHLNRLSEFIQQVIMMSLSNMTSTSGLTAAQIQSMPFYQAALCLAWSDSYNTTPLGMYDALHSGEYYVTEAQAYEATQYAIWAALGDYGIEYNTLKSDSSEVTQKALAVKLLNYATADQVLRSEPDESNVSITGDAAFVYDPSSGTWKTGALKIAEGTNYNGMYTLTLPEGITAQTANGSTVTSIAAGISFYLVSSTKPTSTDMKITASSTLTWLQEYRQYSPNPETYTASDGKNFQHMIGAVIKQKPVSAMLTLIPAKEGSLTVSKSVEGETGSAASFSFTVTLGNTAINGQYGDMAFTNGVATVTLKNGESATAEHLPAGTTYEVAETPNADYASTATGASGTIAKDETATAAFTNARLYKLSVSKTVQGQAADASQAFAFTITLKDADGKPLSGTYAYTGGSVSGSSATAPADGTITFDAKGAGSVSLRSGQQITIGGIPSGSSYTVQEVTSNEDNALKYDVTYNGTQTVPSGTLSADATVAVVNAVQEGALSVTKHVTGEVNSTRNFTFTVKLGGSGANLTGTYGDMEFSNGEATFTLADGQTKTAEHLPAGATYTVTEEPNDSYTTTSENAEGTIAKGVTSQASFTNTRSMSSLPLTGSDGVGLTYLAGIAVLAAAAAWMHIRRNASAKGGDGRD